MHYQTLTNKLNLLAGATGGIIILLAMGSFTTQMALTGIFDWLDKVFSLSFVLLYSLLLAVGIAAGLKLQQHADDYWYEIGQQAGNGLATLALTYTLIGISMGIGSLADQQLTPETVNDIIGKLTGHFATAFMTTIVGLPTANIIRAWVSIAFKKHSLKQRIQEN